MLKFTSQPRHETVDIQIPYRATQDEELTETLIEAIGILVAAIGSARGQDISGDPEDLRWTKEFLVGFALLAIGEARSMLLLLSDNLNRHARVHLRSMYEYELRVKILLADPKKGLMFRDSLAYEMRDLCKRLGGSMEAINKEIAESLGIDDTTQIVGAKEKDAFGGSVRNQMKDEIAPEQRYIGTFAWASLVSHGSILSLRELARVTQGATNDLLARSAEDDKGNVLLYNASWLTLGFAGNLYSKFGVSIAGMEMVANKIIAINKRLTIVSPEQEDRALKARAAHMKKG
jgi:hypothetical protein